MNNKLIRQLYKIILGISTLTGLFFGALSEVSAGGPHPYLSYQGRLSDQNGNLLTGNYYITFCIYSSSSPGTNCAPAGTPAVGAVSTLNSALWGETQYFSATNSPDNHVINGVFNAKLGTQSAFGSTLFSANSQLWIGINVYNGSSWDGQMSPLQEIVSNGYSITAGGLAVGTAYDTASATPAANNIPVLDGSGNLTLPSGGTLFVGGGSGLSITSTAITAPGALAVSSGGSAALTLTSKSGSLVLGAGTNTITNTDASTALTLNPTGNLQFFNANSFVDSSGNVTLAGNITQGTGIFTQSGNSTSTITGNQLTLSPIAAASTAPTISDGGTGGSLAAGTYFGKYSWYNTNGETTVSSESSSVTIALNHKINFSIPTIPTNATGAHLYLTAAGGASGSEVLQAVNITSGTTGTVSSFTAGASPQFTNGAGGQLNLANTINETISGDSFTGLILANTLVGGVTSPAIRFTQNTASRTLRASNGTTNPYITLLNSSGVSVDSFDNNGEILVLAQTGYTGILANFELNATSEFSVDYQGNVISKGQISSSENNDNGTSIANHTMTNLAQTATELMATSAVVTNAGTDVTINANVSIIASFTGTLVTTLYRSTASSTCASGSTELTSGVGRWGEQIGANAPMAGGFTYLDKNLSAATYYYCVMLFLVSGTASPVVTAYEDVILF